MIDVKEKKRKIISFLETGGPSLPVRIAKAIEMEPVFASAILSELLSSKEIKVSNLKIGASPLYLIPGQEEKLENHVENLKHIEKETFLRLKKGEIISDENEEPATRVALRNIKDFAIPFKSEEKIMWKYSFTPEEEIKEESTLEEETKEEIIPKEESVPKAWEMEIKKEEIKKEIKGIESIFTAEPEEESDFLKEIKTFLESENIEFLEEIQADNKEISAKTNIKTSLGNINFLLIAKNKKTITEDEVNSSIKRATYGKMPCLLILRREPSRKIQKMIEDNHLIKLKTLE